MSKMKRKFEKFMKTTFPRKELTKNEYGSYVDERVSCMWDVYIMLHSHGDTQ